MPKTTTVEKDFSEAFTPQPDTNERLDSAFLGQTDEDGASLEEARKALGGNFSLDEVLSASLPNLSARREQELGQAPARLADLLKARDNVPLTWLQKTQFSVSNGALQVRVPHEGGRQTLAVLRPEEPSGWAVFSSVTESYKDGGMQVSLADKGATGEIARFETKGMSDELPGALSLLCEILERETLNSKIATHLETGGVQRMKSTSYALTRNHVTGVTPVLVNGPTASLRALGIKKNHNLGFAGMVVDKNEDFLVLSAGSCGLLGFLPTALFPEVKNLHLGDTVGLRVSKDKGLQLYPVALNDLRDALIIASNSDSEDLSMTRVREYICKQFADNLSVFAEGKASIEPLSLDTTPARHAEIDGIKHLDTWQTLGSDILNDEQGRPRGLSSEALTLVDDRVFGAEHAQFRDLGDGRVQVLAVFAQEGSDRHYAELIHLHGDAAPLISRSNETATTASAKARGELLGNAVALATMGGKSISLTAEPKTFQVKGAVNAASRADPGTAVQRPALPSFAAKAVRQPPARQQSTAQSPSMGF